MKHAQEIASRYVERGWRGQALDQRLERHARLLDIHDPQVAYALRRSVSTHIPWPRKDRAYSER